jgi:hypothetical protein
MRFRPLSHSSLSLRLFSVVLTAALAPCARAQLSVSIGVTSAVQTATVVITATGTSAGSNPVYVLTQGAQNSDFKLINGGTCAANTSYSTLGATCTVKYNFTPSHPGIRYGGITLVTSTGVLLGNTYINATGIGPQALFTPAPQSSVPLPQNLEGGGVAVDGNGNIYVGDFGEDPDLGYGPLDEIPAGCTQLSCIKTISTAFYGPSSLVVDGSGNLFVGDMNPGATFDVPHVFEFVAVGGVIPDNPTPVPLAGTDIYEPFLALDVSGDLYIANTYDDQLLKLTAVNGVIPTWETPTEIYQANGQIISVAVDTSGNVYFAEDGESQVSKIAAADGSVTSFGNGFGPSINSMAFDGEGNLYVADQENNAVKEVLAVNGLIPANPTITTLSSSIEHAYGIAVDSSQNLYAVSYAFGLVLEYAYSSPPTMAWRVSTSSTTETQH